MKQCKVQALHCHNADTQQYSLAEQEFALILRRVSNTNADTNLDCVAYQAYHVPECRLPSFLPSAALFNPNAQRAVSVFQQHGFVSCGRQVQLQSFSAR